MKTSRWIKGIILALICIGPLYLLAMKMIALLTVLVMCVILDMMTTSYILTTSTDEFNLGSTDTMDLTKNFSCEQLIEFTNISSSDFIIDRVKTDTNKCFPINFTRTPLQPKQKGTLKVRHKNIRKYEGDQSDGDIQLFVKCGPQKEEKKLLIHFSRKVIKK
jgi:hypothetical protein